MTAGKILTRWIESERGASFSVDRAHRYRLHRTPVRIADHEPFTVAVCGCNPSKADEADDDHTIRRASYFAVAVCREQNGAAEVFRCGVRLVMINLDALVATDPRYLLAKPSSTAVVFNRATIDDVLTHADHVICAWGDIGEHYRPDEARAFLATCADKGKKPLCLGTTKSGAPKHPARLPNKTPITRYTRAT